MSTNVPFTNINIKLLLTMEKDIENKKFLLSKLHRRILDNNIKNIIQIIIKKRNNSQIFKIKNIILLIISSKNRLTKKLFVFFCYIIKITKKIYILLS
jgi:hypothetical protein